jgi:hypothetical protein
VSVEFQQILGSSFISFLLSFMLMKVWLPFAPKRGGQVLLVVPTQFLQRVLIHRSQALVVLAYVLFGSSGLFGDHWFLPGTQPIAVTALVAIMSLPVRYVFSDQGVAIGNQIPRPYKAFRRFHARAGRRWLASTTTVVLEGRRTQRGTSPSFKLFLPTDAMPEVTRLLKRRVR